MCDYSLMHFPNRLALEGEELLTHRFPSGSMGLVAEADLKPKASSGPSKRRWFWAQVNKFFSSPYACSTPAVCIPPGARLRLYDIKESFRREYKLQANEEIRFEQLSADENTYRDVICFQNGRRVRVQQLPEGQRARVLSLRAENEPLELEQHAELTRRFV
jgi:hypothetical protein